MLSHPIDQGLSSNQTKMPIRQFLGHESQMPSILGSVNAHCAYVCTEQVNRKPSEKTIVTKWFRLTTNCSARTSNSIAPIHPTTTTKKKIIINQSIKDIFELIMGIWYRQNNYWYYGIVNIFRCDNTCKCIENCYLRMCLLMLCHTTCNLLSKGPTYYILCVYCKNVYICIHSHIYTYIYIKNDWKIIISSYKLRIYCIHCILFENFCNEIWEENWSPFLTFLYILLCLKECKNVSTTK